MIKDGIDICAGDIIEIKHKNFDNPIIVNVNEVEYGFIDTLDGFQINNENFTVLRKVRSKQDIDEIWSRISVGDDIKVLSLIFQTVLGITNSSLVGEPDIYEIEDVVKSIDNNVIIFDKGEGYEDYRHYKEYTVDIFFK